MKIILVELPATPNGKLFEEPAQDVYSFFYLPSRAIDLLHGIAHEAGFIDTETINPRFNGGKEIITEQQLNKLYQADVIGLSAITRTIPQSYELADMVRQNNPRAKIIYGGPHATALPEEALEHGDYVVRNEGDATFPELLRRIENNFEAPEVEDIQGISYRGPGGMVTHTPDREFLSPEELTAQALPIFSEDTIKKTRHFTINTSRGCPHKCEFCSVIAQFGSVYRTMDNDRTIEYIKYVISKKKDSGKYSIFFGDDHFAANIRRTKDLLRRMKTEIPDMPRWSAQVRVETAYDKELLSLMKENGCFKVYIGFESIDEKTLKVWNKHQNIEKIEHAIKAYHSAGITIHGMFVFGSDFDTKNSVNKTVKFANRMNIDTLQFVSLLPLPGTPLCRQYEQEDKILSREWHLYSGHQVIINPAGMTPFQLQESIKHGLRKFYNLPNALKQLFRRDIADNRRSNFVLRSMGMALRYLSIREMREHTKRLRKLDSLTQRLNKEYEAWLAHLKKAVGGVSAKASVRKELILREFTQLSSNLNRLKQSYKERYSRLNKYIVEKAYIIAIREIKEKFLTEIRTYGIKPHQLR